MSDSETAARRLAGARVAVIKVGSALIVGEDGEINAPWLASLAEDVASLKKDGKHTIIVSSGAIAVGRKRLKLKGRISLAEKQAAAAAGQARLIEAWQEALSRHSLLAAQVLLTLDDTENRRRYLNARATLAALLNLGAIPVINENDTVATAEIRYGDNDRLSAHAAQMSGADLLILLSDVDGLYTADPRKDAGAVHRPFVPRITAEIEAMAGEANAERGVGSGGMATKIAAAKIATGAGAAVVIAKGDIDRPISAIASGGRATLFAPQSTPSRARRAWIGGRLSPVGSIGVDPGAAAALLKGASLLPAGVVSIDGDFRRGDAVKIVADGRVLGQGLSGYDAPEARRLIGRKSADIERVLGYTGPTALIHRDDLALAGSADEDER